MSQRVTTEAPLLRSKRREIPAALEAVVWRALRREPSERYPSMAAFRDDLTHLENVEIPVYPSSTEGGKQVSREHLVNALVIVGVLVLLAVIGVVAQLAHAARGSP